tara:strand:+ start:907 stop:1263 length:357 start_codon:yes stop_codon:yes gene_type:complete
MAYSVVKKDGKIKDFIQGVKEKRANKNVKFTDVVDTARLKRQGGLSDKLDKYATQKDRPFRQSTKIKYSIPRAEFKADKESSKGAKDSYKHVRREARLIKLGKLAMGIGITSMLTSNK